MCISELGDGSIAVSRLEEGADGDAGAAEAAGLRVGDRLVGANYQPFRGGLSSVVALFQEAKVGSRGGWARGTGCVGVLRRAVLTNCSCTLEIGCCKGADSPKRTL